MDERRAETFGGEAGWRSALWPGTGLAGIGGARVVRALAWSLVAHMVAVAAFLGAAMTMPRPFPSIEVLLVSPASIAPAPPAGGARALRGGPVPAAAPSREPASPPAGGPTPAVRAVAAPSTPVAPPPVAPPASASPVAPARPAPSPLPAAPAAETAPKPDAARPERGASGSFTYPADLRAAGRADGAANASRPAGGVTPSALPGPSAGAAGAGRGAAAVAGSGSPAAGVAGPGAAQAGPGDGTGIVPRAPEALRSRIQSRVAYPDESIRREEEGEVLLRVLVGAGGDPREIRLEKSSGLRRLDEAARRGVRGAAPLPSIPGWYEVPVRFSLR